MKASVREIFPAFYNDAQVEASVKYVSAVDRMLVEDGTYFVLDAKGELVACGGWSRRNKLFSGVGDAPDDAALLDPATQPAPVRAMFVRQDWTRRGLGTRILRACEAAAREEGFTRLRLMATLPGMALYEAYGFRVVAHSVIVMPDGTEIASASMEKLVA